MKDLPQESLENVVVWSVLLTPQKCSSQKDLCIRLICKILAENSSKYHEVLSLFVKFRSINCLNVWFVGWDSIDHGNCVFMYKLTDMGRIYPQLYFYICKLALQHYNFTLKSDFFAGKNICFYRFHWEACRMRQAWLKCLTTQISHISMIEKNNQTQTTKRNRWVTVSNGSQE